MRLIILSDRRPIITELSSSDGAKTKRGPVSAIAVTGPRDLA